MKITPISLDISWESPLQNMERIKPYFENTSDIFVLPELFSTGFTMNPRPFAESIPGRTTDFLCRMAQEKRSWIIGSCIETNDEKPFNSAFAINPEGSIVNIYRKVHLFSYAGEDSHYTPGSKAEVFDVHGIKAAIQICYDLRFPESFTELRRQGAELVFVIANWPKSREHHWHTLLMARAIENQMIICGVNRTGNGYEFNGSIIYDEQGLKTNIVDVSKTRKWRALFRQYDYAENPGSI